ncbi:type II secretion system protein [Geosporobacter ferrireducens]|uniref:Prepilin-type N-terminal cleavage/methylation domain-containing protein n=1 Tax=Geosporobacter ferrireducens TaxID=1424294 RepID=A0A1D8GB75_9FIRM|nr:type II secretion system protein [Geosporobacter ferrireducens]AOT68169.1 hypothetical protein Gferi_00370 [Geosporobacter ferrireducens]
MKVKQKGYTLIELVLVVSLMSLLTSIAAPRMDKTFFNMKVYSRELCADIRYIRLMKMTEGGAYRILLHEEYYRVLNGSKELKTVELPKHMQLLYPAQVIRFNQNGAPSWSGTISVRDKKSGRYYEITIVPASGRVLLKDEIKSS